MKYIVLRNCYGFKGRYWHEGTVIELDESEKPPKQFEKINGEPKTVVVEKELNSFSEIQKAQSEQDLKPVGMAAKPKLKKSK